MASTWEKYSRFTLKAASTASNVGFTTAKTCTKLGFAITRGVASSVAGITGTTFDYAVFGASAGTGVALGGAVYLALSVAEKLALFPIQLGETLTSSSLVAAQGSIDTLSAIFPGSDEPSFSLASFVTLVRREWNDPVMAEYLPEERYSVGEVGRALVGWGALQGVTHDWQVQKWLKNMKEIKVHEDDGSASRTRLDSRVHVTTDIILPHNDGQILTADIGEAPNPSRSIRAQTRTRGPRRMSTAELKATLRRLSKMVLAGYGGAGLIFFGVSPFPATSTVTSSETSMKDSEEATLAHAVDAAEDANAAQTGSAAPANKVEQAAYSWWNILLGKHDREILEHSAGANSTAVIGNEMKMPRYWVLTDHGRRQIVLVLRGTMSLNELAVDLTCDPEPFEPATSKVNDRADDNEEIPGSFNFPSSTISSSSSAFTTAPAQHQVHSGMLRMARAMGEVGKPVHVALRDALLRNHGYELVLCGHSLGAGVAGLLALLWADPETCLTVRSSGLPVGRRVSAYCFAPPCITSLALASLSSNLITSFVYSHDVVSRLSLGSIRDMVRAAVWLCKTNANSDGYAAVTRRALKWKAGFGTTDDDHWFLSIRKTLEANMQMSNLFPPGRVLWAIRDEHLRSTTLPNPTSAMEGEGKLRLFEVLDVENVFSQIIFSRDMLSSHLPHQYDRALHEIL